MFVPDLEKRKMVVKQTASRKATLLLLHSPRSSEDAVRRPATLLDCANMFDSYFYIFINLLFQIEN